MQYRRARPPIEPTLLFDWMEEIWKFTGLNSQADSCGSQEKVVTRLEVFRQRARKI
jgi:hypothetical protein